MRYYFAGAYLRRAELKLYADQLHAAQIGASVVARWLEHDASALDAGFSAGNLGSPAAVERAWQHGQRDVEDLSMCHAIVSFTGEGTRGGRHVEHGIALAIHEAGAGRSMRLIVVGPREHVFHCHPDTEVYEDFGAFRLHEIVRYREGER